MPTRPLLRLPPPNPVAPPPGPRGGSNIRFPSAGRQKSNFGPIFERLRGVLSQGTAELREDPNNLAPERVIVFEIAGTVQNFLNAVSRINGLEFMAEHASEFAADQDFAVKDARKATKGQDRADKLVPGRLYLVMPDVRALAELLSLWDRWRRGEALGTGYTPFEHLFGQLHALRPWGPQDRIPEETLAFWREERERHPDRAVRTEVELWYHENDARRRMAEESVESIVNSGGGRVIHRSVIPDIAYHGMLVDIASADVQSLIEDRAVQLARADDVMFLRPQSILLSPLETEAESDGLPEGNFGPPPAGQPIAALLDGMPLQAHALLVDRLLLDDPDDLQRRAVVSRRLHGTAMASLILHGDRNQVGQSLPRPLYVRPVMITDEQGQEHTDTERLVIDTIYRAVLRIKGSEGEEAAAPAVFLINLSVCDRHRPFAGQVSPLARLLDFLSERYGLLFLVSAGNVSDPLAIPDFDNWSLFESAVPNQRERAVVKALNAAKRDRTILSPAESLNALTIGGQHHDSVSARQGQQNVVDPFEDNTLPNVSSGLGLGYRRMIKPDLYFPGGREHVRMQSTGDGLRVSITAPRRLYGLNAAALDAFRSACVTALRLTLRSDARIARSRNPFSRG
jgi:Subtilase family